MSSVELLNYFSTSDDLDSPDAAASERAVNGDLTADNDQGELKLVYLDKDGSGPPKLSVHFSHSAPSPDKDAYEGETENLLQEEVRTRCLSHAH